MGADITVKKPKNLDERKLLREARLVPIDVDVDENTIHFHYGYWGLAHGMRCEQFVIDFCEEHNVKRTKESY